MSRNVAPSKASTYFKGASNENFEKISTKCQHNPTLIHAIGISDERAEEIKQDIITKLNKSLCVACTMEYVTYTYSGVERAYAGYIIGALAEQQKTMGMFPQKASQKKIQEIGDSS